METADHSIFDMALKSVEQMETARSSPIDPEPRRGHPRLTIGYSPDTKKRRSKQQQASLRRPPVNEDQWHSKAKPWRGRVLSHDFVDMLEGRR